MPPFRSFTPKRSNVKTVVANYKEHKTQLMADYKNRCGYCDDPDKWRFVWFEIDHFVPQYAMKLISETDYRNLVYACRSCNNAKRAKWPTGDENMHNLNDKGFIDPCDDNYNSQFERTEAGRILPVTKLGEWKYNALKLYKPQHEILWNIEQLHLLIDEIKSLQVKDPANDLLKNRLIETYDNYNKYLEALFKL